MPIKQQRDIFLGEVVLLKIGRFTYTIIDSSEYPYLSQFRWRLRKSHSCYYVCRKVKTGNQERTVFLHRYVTHCPPDKQVHHKNHNTLDNRLENLLVCTKKEHYAQAGKVYCSWQ